MNNIEYLVDYTLPAYLNLPNNKNITFVLWLIKDTFHQLTIVNKLNDELALKFAFEQFKCSDKIKQLYKEKHGK